MDIKNLQKIVGEFNKKHDLDLSPSDRLMDMASETGEVAKELLKATNYGKQGLELTNELKGEVGDLFYTLLSLAEEANIDLEKECQQTLDKYRERLKKIGSIGSGQ